MSIIFALMLLQWFESLISKIFMVPYLIGYYTVGGSNSTLKQWWSEDTSKMIPLSIISQPELPLFIGGLFQWHYILSVFSVLFILALERSFACYFISDYEQTPRNYLLAWIMIFYHMFVLLMTYCFFYAMFHFATSFCFCLFPNIFASIMFLYTENYNRKIVRRFEHSPTQYTLASRFQAKENYRAQRLVTRVIICAMLMLFIGLCLVTVLLLELVPILDTFINYIVDNLIHSNPLIICPVFITSVKPWRVYVIQHFSPWRHRRVSNLETPPSTNLDTKSVQLRLETDTYFKQLESAWY